MRVWMIRASQKISGKIPNMVSRVRGKLKAWWGEGVEVGA
jgi:hypothetical protein